MLSLSQARTRRVRAVGESFFVSKIEKKALPHSALNRSAAVLFALLGGLSLIVVSLPSHLLPPPRALTSFPEARVPVSSLPFSFEDTVTYFSATLGSAPRQRQNDYAFFEIATSVETTLQVALTRQGTQMLLRFRIEDEYGMDVVRNFCKAPFFQSEERDLLYALFSAGEGIHYASMPRFYVLCEYDMRPERTLVTFLFSPPVQFCGVIPAGL
jgi:hypothetical protein